MTGSEGSPDDEVTYREIDTEATTPEVAVVRTIGDLEERDPADLPEFYATVDHLLEHLFSDPPAAEAQARVEFTYAGYRVAVNQDGRTSFRKVEAE